MKSEVMLEDIDYAVEAVKRKKVEYEFIVTDSQNSSGPEIKDKLRKLRWEDFAKEKKIFRKSIDNVRIQLLLNEKEALICLPDRDGKIDQSSGLYGTKNENEAFYNLCNNYFESKWAEEDNSI